MRSPDWARVPERVQLQLALAATQKFAESGDAPEGIESYEWYWTRFDADVARIRLKDRVLIRRFNAGSLWLRTAYVKPAWEMVGGARERERADVPLRMQARVGWHESQRIAVLFFAEGGSFPALVGV